MRWCRHCGRHRRRPPRPPCQSVQAHSRCLSLALCYAAHRVTCRHTSEPITLSRTCSGLPRIAPNVQEAEDGHSEEMSTLRDAREELKSQLKAAKAQANENSSIAQVCTHALYHGTRYRYTRYLVPSFGVFSPHNIKFALILVVFCNMCLYVFDDLRGNVGSDNYFR